MPESGSNEEKQQEVKTDKFFSTAEKVVIALTFPLWAPLAIVAGVLLAPILITNLIIDKVNDIKKEKGVMANRDKSGLKYQNGSSKPSTSYGSSTCFTIYGGSTCSRTLIGGKNKEAQNMAFGKEGAEIGSLSARPKLTRVSLSS